MNRAQPQLSKGSKLYVNVVRFISGEWGICWYPQWTSSDNLKDAVRQRREFIAYLQREAPAVWRARDVKTIRII